MKTFLVPPDLQTVLTTCASILALPLPTAAGVSGYAGVGYRVAVTPVPPNLPSMPARPADPAGAALYDHLVAPLYAIAVQFQQDMTAALKATAPLPASAGPLVPTTGLVQTATGFVTGPVGGSTTPFVPGSVADGYYQAFLAEGYAPDVAYSLATNAAQSALGGGVSP